MDGGDLSQWKAAITPETRILFLETPSNPTLSIVDLRAVAKIADGAGALVLVDNAFASPALQRPMEFGADIVVHSSTKYIDGQGRALGGVVCAARNSWKDISSSCSATPGPSIAPFNAWLHLKSLETLGAAHESALRERRSRWPTSWPASAR